MDTVTKPSEGRADLDRLGPYGTWPYVERRRGTDRRAEKTRPFGRFFLRGLRARGRRRGESENLYVDRYERRDLWLAVSILGLNVLDAGFTLAYLDGDSSREANPIARFLIDQGFGWFIFSKAFVVGLCLFFLTVHKTFRWVRPAMVLLCFFYSVLLLYHLYLQWLVKAHS